MPSIKYTSAPRLLIALLASATLLEAQLDRKTINFDTVAKEAAELIESAPRGFAEKVSKPLIELNYDDYRNIRFRPSEALWWNDPSKFRVEFFHLGHIFLEPVEIFEFTDTHVQKIPFREDAYNYEQSSYKPGFFNAPNNYAGIRVKYPLNNKDVYDDLIVFLGASYFRALGPDQTYGLSLRGIAMNSLGGTESFPRFTKLWLKKPAPDDQELYIYALLEGEKVTGAYRFIVRSNGTTEIDVKSRLYFREDGISEVLLAPITSMFVFGENSQQTFGDWRPEVHDSDGVLIQSAENNWTWHPLENIQSRYVKSFDTPEVLGYGLMQRDRNFANYKDLEADYQNRPSAWITPKENWPKGSVVLYSFGTDSEAVDNVNLFWKPEVDAELKGPMDLEYTVALQLKSPEHSLAKVIETRIGHRTLDANARTLVVEFTRPESIPQEDIPSLRVELDLGPLEIIGETVLQFNPSENRIRLFVNFSSPSPETFSQLFEMSAQLWRDQEKVSENWSYTWNP